MHWFDMYQIFAFSLACLTQNIFGSVFSFAAILILEVGYLNYSKSIRYGLLTNSFLLFLINIMHTQFNMENKIHNLIKKARTIFESKFSNSLRNFFFPHPQSLQLLYHFLFSRILSGVWLILVGITHNFLDHKCNDNM